MHCDAQKEDLPTCDAATTVNMMMGSKRKILMVRNLIQLP
ncbi:hypothetical protein HMPREF1985_00059 [Mitsuokella sp. oral taxon 131 str. W9106]|nr:hypothetical protein HMPREF1985_00059 [Mitsuokella sp. oral taxon 131 str. W9106]